MKKVFLTLAIFVMAFGNANLFAQRSERLAQIQKQVMEQYRGSSKELGYYLETAVYSEIDGNAIRTFRNTYTYDEYDYYLIEVLTEEKIDGSWMNYTITTCEYDFAGNPLEVLTQVWEDGAWENESFVTYAYDNEGFLSEMITQEWEDGDWENVEKSVYNYLDDTQTMLTYLWDGSVWRTNELYTIMLNMNGYEILVQYMQGGAWQNDEKLTYTWNDFYMIDNLLIEDWVNNAWQNDELYKYYYNGEYITSINIEEWENGGWATEAKFSYEYQNGNATYGHFQEYENGQWVEANGTIEMFYSENAATEVFEDANEVNIEYVDLTSVAENQVKAFSVYPNPASDCIAISGEGFKKAEVYNTVGQKVRETTMNTISVNGLQSGVYMLKVYDANGNVKPKASWSSKFFLTANYTN